MPHDIINWGKPYYYINELGNIAVCPNPYSPESSIELNKLAEITKQKGCKLPLLFCFPQIIQHRLRTFNETFKKMCTLLNYEGKHLLVYPIKVNQCQYVTQSLIDSDEPLGLEAGSKAELVAVLCYAKNTANLIVCNGYKDIEYIRLALTSSKIGHEVYIVIEKLSEIYYVLEEAKHLNIRPKLGIRACLYSGNNTNKNRKQVRSKFGLTSNDILELVEILRKSGYIDCLHLLHFHLGSQISNINSIKKGVKESAQLYFEMSTLGVNIKYFDVGGGLGVNYEGKNSCSQNSTNYSLYEYAKSIINGIKKVCQKHFLPHPTIITESGRFITAHHAVLVSNIITTEQKRYTELNAPHSTFSNFSKDLWKIWEKVGKKSCEQDQLLINAQKTIKQIQHAYSNGNVRLKEKSWSETLYFNICYQMREKSISKTSKIKEELNYLTADKIYINFSLFQSMPDSWAIGQIFPTLPLTGISKKGKKHAVLLDMTCDSDGRINFYVGRKKISRTIAIDIDYSQKLPFMGFFMVGAYQRTLGNIHNLIGKPRIVQVFISSDKNITMKFSGKATSISDMLNEIGLDSEREFLNLYHRIKNEFQNKKQKKILLESLSSFFKNHTYLNL